MFNKIIKLAVFGWALLLTMVLSSQNVFAGGITTGGTIEIRTSKYLPLTCDFDGKIPEQNTEFPRNFRTTDDDIKGNNGDLPSLGGLRDLQVAGTGQFTENQLLSILNYMGGKVLVIDLREETHLIFEDVLGKQIPITAYLSQNTGNVGKSLKEIEKDLILYKDHINLQDNITLHYTLDSEVQFDEADPKYQVGYSYTEREIVEKLNNVYSPGVEYLLIPVTDHKNPSPYWVDYFIQINRDIKARADGTEILFHCKAGRGRTGVFMIMKDMIENALKYGLSFEDILERQRLLGSPDFSHIKPGREENSQDRYNFLRHFYEYVISSDGLESGTTYSQWLENHSTNNYYQYYQAQQAA